MDILEVTQWEPYEGPDADVVAKSRANCDGSNILFRVKRAINIQLFREQDENQIDSWIEARSLVSRLLWSLSQ